MPHNNLWVDATIETVASYRRLIDASVAQLTDEQFFARPQPDFNSVAILLRHLGGNLQSRWTKFLTEDGEKESRDRDKEFADWSGDRAALMEYFDGGWQCLCESLAGLSEENISRTVLIRGESHSVPQAVLRSVTHLSYHVGQLLLLARMMHSGKSEWQWLTIRPGTSLEHNSTTWGTKACRGVAGGPREE